MKLVDLMVKLPRGVLKTPKPQCEGGNEEIVLSVPEMVRKYEYPVEVYADVLTEDKYLLEVYRIPHGRINLDMQAKRHPVLLMHGLLGSSADFVLMGPERGLAYLLADLGYDVWLGNARGTSVSCKHQELDPKKDKRYWKFSWHEIGIYDLPAIFNLIQKVTGQETFSYIGMSQGTTVFFVCLSQKPEYNKRVSVMIALAPVAFLEHLHSPLPKRFSTCQRYIGDLLPKNMEVPPPFLRKALQVYNRMYCHNNGLYQHISLSIFFSLLGHDPEQMKEEYVPKIFSKLPDRASARQFFHFGQCVGTKNFRQYDFGHKRNLELYGTIQPPSYNLSSITTPVALCYGKGDWLSRPQDVFRLSRELPNCVSSYQVRYYSFNHYDFISACDINELCYNYIFRLLEEYK